MDEYIDREKTVKALDKLCDRICQYSKKQRKVMCGSCPLGDAFTVIEDDLAAADVVPVRHGKWKSTAWEAYTAHCSECGHSVGYLSNYCPNCGARMDGADDV